MQCNYIVPARNTKVYSVVRDKNFIETNKQLNKSKYV